nr:hypothetical protein [Ruegeria haliotis]
MDVPLPVFKDLLHAFLGVEDVGATKERCCGDFQQIRVCGKRKQAKCIFFACGPHISPACRSLGNLIGVRAQRDVPRNGANRLKPALRVTRLKDVRQIGEVRNFAFIQRLEQFLLNTPHPVHTSHQRDIGRGLFGADGIFKLHQPCFTGGDGDGFNFNAGGIGEFGIYVFFEAVFKEAAIGANLDRRFVF